VLDPTVTLKKRAWKGSISISNNERMQLKAVEKKLMAIKRHSLKQKGGNTIQERGHQGGERVPLLEGLKGAELKKSGGRQKSNQGENGTTHWRGAFTALGRTFWERNIGGGSRERPRRNP